MKTSMYLFALGATSFAARMRESTDELLQLVKSRLESESGVDADEIPETLDLVREICSGRLPDDCSEGYFNALCWLCDVATDAIKDSWFRGTKGNYLESLRIWEFMQRDQPPFAVPKTADSAPEVGFLYSASILDFAIPGIAALPPSEPNVQYGRDLFVEILESLADDGLDLLAILM